MANTGWTWDDALDSLTLPRLAALQAEWRANPPVHWLVAAALKYRAPEATEEKARRPTMAAMKAVFGGGAA